MKKSIIYTLIFLLLSIAFLYSDEQGVSLEEETRDFPEYIYIKSERFTFNKRYYYALSKSGRIYIKPNPDTGLIEEWKLMGKGKGLPYNDRKKDTWGVTRISKISVDNNKFAASAEDGTIYTIYHLLGDEGKYKWQKRWGHPLEYGEKLVLPDEFTSWCISNGDPEVVRYYHDGSGNKFNHLCTSLYVLSKDGQEIRFSDPWTPADFGYQIATPFGGTFQALNMDASSSTIFIINKYGDMYTRQADFDILGANPSPAIVYSYYPQKKMAGVHNFYKVRTIPPPPWKNEPKIPGKITKDITIFTNGEGSFARMLRVKGINSRGEVGYWEKRLVDPEWKEENFRHVPGMIIEESELLENSEENRFADTLGERKSFSYVGYLDNEEAKLELIDFHFFASPAILTCVTRSGKKIQLLLRHHITFRTNISHAPGLDGTNHKLSGAIEISKDVYANADVKEFMDRNFSVEPKGHSVIYIPVNLSVNSSRIILSSGGKKHVLLNISIPRR